MKRFGINQKVFSSLFIVLIFFSLAVGAGYRGLSQVIASMERVDKVNLLVEYIALASLAEKDFMNTSSEDSVVQVRHHLSQLLHSAKELKAQFPETTYKDKMENVIKAANSFNSAFEQYVELDRQVKQHINDTDAMSRKVIDSTDLFRKHLNSCLVDANIETLEAVNKKQKVADEALQLLLWTLETEAIRNRLMHEDDFKLVSEWKRINQTIIGLAFSMKSRVEREKNIKHLDNIIESFGRYEKIFLSFLVTRSEADKKATIKIAALAMDEMKAIQREQKEQLIAIETESNDFLNMMRRQEEDARAIILAFRDAQRDEKEFFLYGKEDHVLQHNNLTDTCISRARDLQPRIDQHHKEEMKNIIDVLTAYKKLFNKTVELIQEQGKVEQSMIDAAENANKMCADAKILQKAVLLDQESWSRNIMVWSAVFSAILGFGIFGLLIRYNIIRPINLLVKSTKRITEGDYTVPIISFKKDEIGDLAEHFKKMRETVREYVNRLELLVKDLERTIAKQKLTENELRESEKEYRNLFDNIYDVYYRTDEKGIITLISPSAEKHLGYTPDELVGNYMKNIYVNPQEREKFLSRLIKDGYIQNFETQLRHKDNSTIWASTNAKFLKDEKGNTLGVEGITRDVTERKEAEIEREKLKGQLQQSQRMESIGTLAGGIAHDFNNILTPIIGYTEMAMENVPHDSRTRKDLAQVFKSSLRAKELVQQILTFSRHQDQERMPVKIQSNIKEAIKFLRATIPTTINIYQNIDNDSAPVMANPTQIHQILMNLCTNAFHAMENKGGSINLSLSNVVLDPESVIPYPGLNPGPFVKLTVSDTGSGMKKEVRERIFEPYFTTKDVDKGTGMGLAVVHGIIASYGGYISVYSEPGKGTAFHVYFPQVETYTVEPKPVSTGPVKMGDEHILLVDDEEINVLMLQQMLEGIGYSVTARTSSLEALEAFRAQPENFDLVLTDTAMPNMTGDQLAKELIMINPDIPIILLSGFSEMMTKQKARTIGIREYVMKPVIKVDLANTIRKVLDKE